MPNLGSSIFMSLSALQAHQSALSVVGHNIGNVNTPGYSRQRAVLETTPDLLFGGVYYGTGAYVNNVLASRDKYLDLQIARETSKQSGAQERFTALQPISDSLADTGAAGMGTQIQSFFQSFQELSVKPEDRTLRTNIIGKANTMISGLQTRYRQIMDQREKANGSVSTMVSEINTLTSQIAQLNAEISTTEVKEGINNDARDRRKVLVDRLAEMIGINVIEDNRGGYIIQLDGGTASLVSGSQSYNMLAIQDPANENFYRVEVQLNATTTVDVTNIIPNGTLGAQLDMRDNVLIGYMNKLDELAAGIAQQTNLAHRVGFGLDGVATNNDFFQSGVPNVIVPGPTNGLPDIPSLNPATRYRGMVFALQVNSAVSNNVDLIAAAGVAGTPGDNAVARTLGNLQFAANSVDTNGDGVLDSGPFSTVVGNIISDVGSQGRTYKDVMSTQDNLLTALNNQRDRIASVDLDEEAAMMMTLQRGYQATARFLSVINQLLDQMVNTR